MDAERWSELKSIFEELLELDREERGSRLATLAARDPELSAQVARLLAADASADERLRLLGNPHSPTPDAAGSDAADAERDPFGLCGRTASHFRVLQLLGAGGMGVVYRAEDLRLSRTVALKFLLPQYSLDPAAKQRFLREARAACVLDHPNVCTIYEAGASEQGQLFLAMSCYTGETLRERLAREGALPVAEAVELARQLLRGLGAAHAVDIVHRDVKPGNLMLTAEGTLKILDFGIARVRDLNLTDSGLRAGTVAYMSPEQLQGEAEVDARSDLWSLGVVLYEMLTGKPAFGAGHELSTIYRIRFEAPAAPAAVRPEIPAALEQLVLRLLSKEPQERYSSAGEVLRSLDTLPAEPVDRSGRGSTQRRRAVPHPLQLLGLGVVLMLGVLGVFAAREPGQRVLGALGIRAGETLLSQGVLAERERILLADFTSSSGDTVLAGMATEAFRIDIAQSPILTLLGPQQVRMALQRMERSGATLLDPELARELAVREGIKAVLAGEISRSGSGYLLSARLVAPESGEILAAHRETARDSTALLPALDRLSKQLRRRIGEPLRSLESNPPLAQVTTSSLEALRKYSQAVHALHVEGDMVRGAAFLEEAVALDSTFAMAYRRLGMLLGTRSESRTRQVEALTRAFTYRSRLPEYERYLLLASYYSHVTGEREKAITAYQSLLDSDSNNPRALADLAFQYSFLHEWPRVEEYALRSWQLDSTAFYPLWLQMVAQFHQRRYGEAQATLHRLTARFPGNWLIGLAAISMAAARGNYAEAAAYAQEERQGRPEDLAWQTRMTWQLARLAAVAGRLSEMERHLLELGELNRRRGTPGEHLSSVLVLARLEMTLGREPEKALERVRQALMETPLSELPPYDRPYTAMAEIHARAGQPARARELLAEWEGLGPVVILQEDQPTTHGVRGEIALATGRAWDALREFQVSELRIGTTFALVGQGRAYDQAGQPDSALVLYERFLAAPDIFRLASDAEWRGPVLERLGQLYEARGDSARAAARYRSFIALWQDADPELQPRVREARRRVAALTPAPPAAR